MLYRLEQLTFQYGERVMLDIPSLTIEKGGSFGLAGPNGSGKTTLLRILAFLEKGYGGRFLFNGGDAREQKDAVKKKVTYLLQDPYLLKRSVFENVAWGLKARGMRHGLRDRVNAALRCVGLDPKMFSARRWNELSGGESKRVALASRLALKPEVLILDEPTANVDRASAQRIRNAIERIREENGVSLVVASHDEIWLHEISDPVLRISGGRIVGRGTDNIIHGPWIKDSSDLCRKELSDGQCIYGACTPGSNPRQGRGIAVLSPTSIIISKRRPSGMSARNILKGVVTHLWENGASGRLRVEVDVSQTTFLCLLTHNAAEELGLLPGKEVWVVFKASSLLWHRPSEG